MGYYTNLHGEISIVPPLPWADFKDSGFLPEQPYKSWPKNGACIKLLVEEDEVETSMGVMITKSAIAVVPVDDQTKAYDIETELQALVNSTNREHQFNGFIEGEGEDNDDMWRLYVKDRKVIRVRPTITWPDAP